MESEQNKEMIQLLRELVKWQRFTALSSLKEILIKTLDKKEKIIVYDLTDGKNKRDDIIKDTGCSAGAISGWWIDWYSKGLLEKVEGRYRKIVSLEEVGINVPKRENKDNKLSNKEEIINEEEHEQQ